MIHMTLNNKSKKKTSKKVSVLNEMSIFILYWHFIIEKLKCRKTKNWNVEQVISNVDLPQVSLNELNFLD